MVYVKKKTIYENSIIWKREFISIQRSELFHSSKEIIFKNKKLL